MYADKDPLISPRPGTRHARAKPGPSPSPDRSSLPENDLPHPFCPSTAASHGDGPCAVPRWPDTDRVRATPVRRDAGCPPRDVIRPNDAPGWRDATRATRHTGRLRRPQALWPSGTDERGQMGKSAERERCSSQGTVERDPTASRTRHSLRQRRFWILDLAVTPLRMSKSGRDGNGDSSLTPSPAA
ncbi:uncharacterized protein B0H18DRAFT_129575 [Fomitopsis serialis]|uniref:uncharacterized protein n=1 Tax=Fomitopsis serialis TaxID=139415 RepID=UPI002008C00D|nr:uncharacterized protein B0H18DRAFT_129575 [Neoantrodia serialis]KAH9930613.1 hypothetical protein B0H18DRAFT_129575 [Neoantrodia serialis]